MSKNITIFLGILVAITLPTILQADEISQPPSPKIEYQLLANSIGTAYQTQIPLMKRIIACESSYSTTATKITKWEQSYGLVQLNLLAHKDITKEEAENPTFAITYLAKNLKEGNGNMWTCYRNEKNRRV
jgi:hypothetical protein